MTFENFEYNEAVIDLETLALTPDAHILSIGIVQINKPENTLHVHVSDDTQDRCIDSTTVEWWNKQSPEAQQAVFHPHITVDLDIALDMIDVFWEKHNLSNAWGHGSIFDIGILQNAYAQYNRKPPWAYWAIRDTRTAIDMIYRATGSKQEPIREGLHHSALDDAMHEAVWMKNIIDLIKI